MASGIFRLPRELQEVVYLYAQNRELGRTCRKFWDISCTDFVRVCTLLYRHRLTSLSRLVTTDSHQSLVPMHLDLFHRKERWESLVGDRMFNEKIGVAIVRFSLADPIFVSVASDFAGSNGATMLMKRLIPIMSLRDVNTALIQACVYGHTEMVRQLVAGGADATAEESTAFCMAAKYGHLECAKLLIEAGADVDAQDGYALCYASRGGHLDLVRALLQSKCNIQIRDNFALNWACEHGHQRVCAILLQHGADIHTADDYPLRWSSMRGHVHVVQLLIAKGANVDAMDNFAIRHAIKFRQWDVVRVLAAASKAGVAVVAEEVRNASGEKKAALESILWEVCVERVTVEREKEFVG
ncbi:hypothetical protein SpCBS45565_g03841 [Spizellomyces sp. 'palustris']|nr:hypothetical protein SpCBS45565_g03841 [Spizellomyces sp. 'palustris']